MNPPSCITRNIEESLSEDIRVEKSTVPVSVTDVLEEISREMSIDVSELDGVEWKVWSDSRPRSIGRINLVYCESFIYIKWTRSVAEGHGVATSLWEGILEVANCPVFAKPVSVPMVHVADKLEFTESEFNDSIVVRENLVQSQSSNV